MTKFDFPIMLPPNGGSDLIVTQNRIDRSLPDLKKIPTHSHGRPRIDLERSPGVGMREPLPAANSPKILTCFECSCRIPKVSNRGYVPRCLVWTLFSFREPS